MTLANAHQGKLMGRLAIRVTPRASRNAIEGWRDGVLRVRLTAPPVNGRANAALIRLLATAFNVPSRDVRVIRGDTARDKLVEVDGLTDEEVVARLNPA